jgi:hypothetical protein
VLRPETFALPERASLSTSQCIGLGTAVVVAVFYAIHDRAAASNPLAAMALDAPASRRAALAPNGTDSNAD